MFKISQRQPLLTLSVTRLAFAAALMVIYLSGQGSAASDQQSAVAETEPSAGVYLYIDASLARSSEILTLVTALAERSATLSEIGEVTVVIADPEPRVHFRSSDPLQIRQGLSTLGLRTFGDEQLVRQRTEFASAGAATTSQLDSRELAARHEAEILRSRLDTLVLWLSQQDSSQTKTLLLVEPAVGVNPNEFYQAEHGIEIIRPSDLGQVARHFGWSVVPVLPFSNPERTVAPMGPSAVGVRVGVPWQGTDTSFRPDLKLDPNLEAYRSLTPDGEAIVRNEEDLQSSLNRLSRSRPQNSTAPTISSSTPASVVAAVVGARGQQFLQGFDDGDFEIDAALVRKEGGFQLTVSLDPQANLGSGPYLAHVLSYDDAENATLRSRPWPPETLSWTLPEPVSSVADQVVIAITNTDLSLWGMNFAVERAAAAPTRVDSVVLLSIPDLPASGLTGRRRFTVEASAEIDRIEVLLDGKRVDSDGRRPFQASVSLGAAAIEHSLVIIGYDKQRNEVARDGRTLNSAARFSVDIVSPQQLTAGPVEVVAEVKTPGDRELRSVDFYWQTRYLGSSNQSPHSQRVLVPLNSEQDGYVRVVATLEDGRIAEDILLAGRQNFSSQVTVELMELYVVVTGKDERPVRNLGQDSFEILENHQGQSIEHFRVAGDLPLTVGLAIDSSLSLFRKLPDVQKAAKGFVRNLVSNRDRAFLVGFGNQPYLEHPPTWNLDGVIQGIGRLQPSGNTAVWEAVDFSLDQLRAVSGRRALVVFYDGDDEDLAFRYSDTLEKARDSQLPVYLVVLNDEAARTQGKGFAVRSRIGKLERLAAAGGGRVFYVRTDQDLDGVFQQIGDELRSHYLLAYYPEDPSLEPEWRPVRVRVKDQGLNARTVEGYVR